jgi:hypothetical protein
VILVGEQGERQFVFRLELRLLRYRVRAGAKYDCIESLEPRESVAERARFDGSTRGVGLGIEVEDHPATTIVAE